MKVVIKAASNNTPTLEDVYHALAELNDRLAALTEDNRKIFVEETGVNIEDFDNALQKLSSELY